MSKRGQDWKEPNFEDWITDIWREEVLKVWMKCHRSSTEKQIHPSNTTKTAQQWRIHTGTEHLLMQTEWLCWCQIALRRGRNLVAQITARLIVLLSPTTGRKLVLELCVEQYAIYLGLASAEYSNLMSQYRPRMEMASPLARDKAQQEVQGGSGTGNPLLRLKVTS